MQKKVVELPGGQQATTSKDISNVGGWDVLDNNQVSGRTLNSSLIGQLRDDIHHSLLLDGIVCVVI